MTLDEKIVLLHTQNGTPTNGRPAPSHALMSAGVGQGIPRLGIPPLEETDAGLGIADPANIHFDPTAMPSNLALGATFDASLAREVGAAIGSEARDRGLGVVLGGGADLIREPRGGRNFEYVSEDPLLTGVMAGASVAGMQSAWVIATLKHFALNDQENGRAVYSADLAEAPARESDLLAFEIALEQGQPGAFMTAYNRVNGVYAAQDASLLTGLLKGDWRFGGWVLSDWGGTHSTVASALAGLDQESGEESDAEIFFGTALKSAVERGQVPMARLDDMVRRILRTRIAHCLFDDPPRPGRIQDRVNHADTALKAAEEGIVLLKNKGDLLPLSRTHKTIVVIGQMADKGVLSGGGSSQVVPRGAIRAEGEPKGLFFGKPRVFDPSSPLQALRSLYPDAAVHFATGLDRAAAVEAARRADVAIVFAERWSNESFDHASLALPDDQDALIEAVASANPKTIVVLETGDPVSMPWLDRVPVVLEAWYPGQRGGEAIAAVITGLIDPSGRLPLSFPADVSQLPRPALPRHENSTSNPTQSITGAAFDIDYNIEGADVGYKWYLRTGLTPLFPFGAGLSFSSFSTRDVTASSIAGNVRVQFDVHNEGQRAGVDVAQVYVDGNFGRRLVGWQRVALTAGETRHVEMSVDPRLLARFDVASHGWHIKAGTYAFRVRPNALADGPGATLSLPDRQWSAQHGACGGVPCGGVAPTIDDAAGTHPKAEPGRASATPRATAPRVGSGSAVRRPDKTAPASEGSL